MVTSMQLDQSILIILSSVSKCKVWFQNSVEYDQGIQLQAQHSELIQYMYVAHKKVKIMLTKKKWQNLQLGLVLR
jgi:hypothetical protein